MVTVNFSLDINIFSKSLWEIFSQWRTLHPSECSEVDQTSQCMLQMMLVKTRTLEQMLLGVPIYPEKPQFGNLLDISSMTSIVRSIYETAYIYHSIFVKTVTPEERDIILCLWKIRGLNNIRHFPIPKELKDIIKPKDKVEIEKYRIKIKELLKELRISDPAKKTLIQEVNYNGNLIKGYQFNKDNDGTITEIKVYGFSDTSFLFGHNNYQEWYIFLSSHSHPSYYGLMEFANMYQNAHDKEITAGLIMMACSILSRFINDLCSVISDGDIIKKKVFPKISTIDIL